MKLPGSLLSIRQKKTGQNLEKLFFFIIDESKLECFKVKHD